MTSKLNRAILVVFAGVLIFLQASTTLAAEVETGGTTVSLPTPVGFVEVTPSMTSVWRFLGNISTSTNRMLKFYIEKSDEQQALAGKMPVLYRSINVQVGRALEAKSFDSRSFAALKEILVKNNGSKQADAKVAKTIEDANGNMSVLTGTDLNLHLGSRFVLPAHVNDEKVLAYSSFLVISLKGGAGNSPKEVLTSSIVTTSLVLVKNKLLMIYVTGSSADLRWTRETAKAMVAAVIASN